MISLGRRGRRKSLKETLGFAGVGCCGGTPASLRDSPDMSIRDEAHLQQVQQDSTQIPAEHDCPAMNLAAALAAERQFRVINEGESDTVQPAVVDEDGDAESAISTPLRVSLMRLLEEADGVDDAKEKGGGEIDGSCCVCMGRNKGAAFIPCGHTFCRVCSRELWLNRGSCPVCNRPILEILDIF